MLAAARAAARPGAGGARADATADEHLDASLPHVAGDYMGEHWLATFALLAVAGLTCSRIREEEFGAPGWIRTSGLKIRSLVLYPAELRARVRL